MKLFTFTKEILKGKLQCKINGKLEEKNLLILDFLTCCDKLKNKPNGSTPNVLEKQFI